MRSPELPKCLDETVAPVAASAAVAAVAAAAAGGASAGVEVSPSTAGGPASGEGASASGGGLAGGVKPGSAIAESKARMGENSYYYSVGKSSRDQPAPAPTPTRKAVSTVTSSLPQATITTYSMIDDEGHVKVQVPLAGAGALPAGAITCDFRERSFDLRVACEGRMMRLHIPILLEEIEAEMCSVRKKTTKLIVVLSKRDASKGWYELRKTKGVGDTEYSKLQPDAGEPVVFQV